MKKELNDSFVGESFKEKEKEDQLNETTSTQGDLNYTSRAEFENDIPKDIDSLSPNHQLKQSKKTSLSTTAKKGEVVSSKDIFNLKSNKSLINELKIIFYVTVLRDGSM